MCRVMFAHTCRTMFVAVYTHRAYLQPWEHTCRIMFAAMFMDFVGSQGLSLGLSTVLGHLSTHSVCPSAPSIQTLEPQERERKLKRKRLSAMRHSVAPCNEARNAPFLDKPHGGPRARDRGAEGVRWTLCLAPARANFTSF